MKLDNASEHLANRCAPVKRGIISRAQGDIAGRKGMTIQIQQVMFGDQKGGHALTYTNEDGEVIEFWWGDYRECEEHKRLLERNT